MHRRHTEATPPPVAAEQHAPDSRAPVPGAPVQRRSRVGASTERAELASSRQVRRKHPHAARRARLLEEHPEVARLYGLNGWSALYTVLLVALQVAVAVFAVGRAGAPCYLYLPLAYVFGAVPDHALWVLVHDATHNLVFSAVWANRLVLCVANVAHVLPSAMMFRYYHILHHIELNRAERDPDVPSAWEARLVGNSRVRKAIWLALFFLFQTLRLVSYSHKVPGAREMAWVALNWAVNAAAVYGVWLAGGVHALAYLLASSVFSIGLHPLGARWVQEHYPTQPFQSTYSYYGPANRVAFNIGFHNEHHDLPSVPWNKLPELKRIAPEYYDTLFAYKSYRQLLREFIWDGKWSLVSRWEADLAAAEKEAAKRTEHGEDVGSTALVGGDDGDGDGDASDAALR